MTAFLSLHQEVINSHAGAYPCVIEALRPITLLSIVEFFGALAWSGALLLSFTGWGLALARLLRLRSLPTAVACATGIATSIFIAGWLNLASLIIRAILLAAIATGLVFYAIFRRSQHENSCWHAIWRQSSTVPKTFFVLAFLLLAFRVAGTVRSAVFYAGDDAAAYLAFPQKMLDTHHFAADPFSERRNTSSLGGGYFLQDLVLATTPLPNVGMADRALGAIVLAGMLLEIGILFELSALQIALMEFLVFLVPQETFNLTFIVLPVPLLLCMVWLLATVSPPIKPEGQPQADQENETRGAAAPLTYAVLAGMTGGAAVALKSTYLPFVGALSLVPFLLYLVRRKARLAFPTLIATLCGILLVLIAWMLAMKWTSGTWLFPTFGRGLDYTRLNLFPAAPRFATRRSFIKVFIQACGLVLLVAILFVTRRRSRFYGLSILVILSSAAAITSLNYASRADAIWRYNFPQFFTAVLVFYLAAAGPMTSKSSARRYGGTFCLGVLALLGMIFYFDMPNRTLRLFNAFASQMTDVEPAAAGVSARHLSTAALRNRYRRAEAAIPTNGNALEYVAYSFLLNYSNRSIFIMDWPGASAPLPGWPFEKNADDLAQYLEANSVRYVIFDYGYARRDEHVICQKLSGDLRFSQWLMQQLRMNLLAVTQLQQLQSRFHLIYDDGSIAVIDLRFPASRISATVPSLTLAASETKVCLALARR